MADQVMRVDGDFKGYVAAAARAEKETSKIAKAASAVGGEFTKSLMRVELLKQGLSKVVQAMEKAYSLNVSSSMNRDERNISIGVSSASLKVDPYKMAKIIEDRKGALSKDSSADTAFLSALAAMSENRKVPLGQGEALEAMEAYHGLGDAGTREGGKGLLSKMNEGYSVKQSLQMLGPVKNPYNRMVGAFERSNQEDRSLIVDQNARSEEGEDARQFAMFQRKVSRNDRLTELYTNWFPDFIQQPVAAGLAAVGGLETNPTTASNNQPATIGLIKQLQSLGQSMQADTNAKQQLNSRPNGKTEAP
jgi:hypothetical protein